MFYLIPFTIGYIIFLLFDEYTFFDLKHLPVFFVSVSFLFLDFTSVPLIVRMLIGAQVALIISDFIYQWEVNRRRKHLKKEMMSFIQHTIFEDESQDDTKEDNK